MDKNEAIAKVSQYVERIRNKYPVAMVVLFGSYARGNATDDSDIDVAVIFNTPIDDMYGVSVDLYRLRRTIDNRIEPILLRNTDTESGFLESVLQSGIIVYENKAA